MSMISMNLRQMIDTARFYSDEGEAWIETTHEGLAVLRAMGDLYRPRRLEASPVLVHGVRVTVEPLTADDYRADYWSIKRRLYGGDIETVAEGRFGLICDQT